MYENDQLGPLWDPGGPLFGQSPLKSVLQSPSGSIWDSINVQDGPLVHSILDGVIDRDRPCQ